MVLLVSNIQLDTFIDGCRLLNDDAVQLSVRHYKALKRKLLAVLSCNLAKTAPIQILHLI